ncbi:MAG TPA: response regulator, partial [Magnetospirillaceae bacterium]|nr:response regulator [Magnetospirillaceae bacterium]
MSFRILVADDESLERRALRRILSGLPNPGIVLLEAANGRQVVEAAAAGEIDLAFLDIRMPGMDGIEAARALKDLRPGARIVFVTAFDKFDYAREALRLGVDEYLLKPASAEEVLAMARRLLDRIAAGRRGAGIPAAGEALALLEEELRSDLGRGDADPGRVSTFLRLRGMEDRTTAAVVLRPVRTSGLDFARRQVSIQAVRVLAERRILEEGWYVLAGGGDEELRCIAASPSGTAGPVAAETLRKVLESLAVELRTAAGMQVLAGACLCVDGAPRFREAREAAAMARLDRPVAVVTAGPHDGAGRG